MRKNFKAATNSRTTAMRRGFRGFRGRRAAGMSLVELMTIVLILSILVTIGVTAGPSLFRQLSRTQVTATIKVLETILTEFRASTGKTVVVKDELPSEGTYNTAFWSKRPANFHGSSAKDIASLSINSPAEYVARSIERFLSITYSNDPRSVMTPLFAPFKADVLDDRPDIVPDPASSKQGKDDGRAFGANKMLEIRDVWGNKMVYKYDENDGVGGDYKNDNFLPRTRRPFFASSGPDGKFGDQPALDNDHNRDANNHNHGNRAMAAEDNIYSFDLDKQ